MNSFFLFKLIKLKNYLTKLDDILNCKYEVEIKLNEFSANALNNESDKILERLEKLVNTNLDEIELLTFNVEFKENNNILNYKISDLIGLMVEQYNNQVAHIII